MKKNPYHSETPERKTFKLLFAFLAILLMILPFVTTFNELLTRIVLKIQLYHFIEDIILPWETRLINVVLYIFGLKGFASPEFVILPKGTGSIWIKLAWNCIGWQSFILFVLTLIVGLKGRFTKISKIKVILFGLSGTFLINIFRISLVVIFAYYTDQLAAIIFHDYFSTIIVILWLFFFWWFSYAYLLEEMPPPQQSEL